MTLERTDARVLFEASIDGIFVANADGRYTDVNPAGCRLLGYSRDELIGRSVAEVVAPASRAEQTALTQRLQAGHPERSEWNLLRKDGTYVLVEMSASALEDGTLIAFVRDISERRRIELGQRDADAKLSGIVALSPDAIISIDAERRITLFNRGAEKMFGYAPAEVLGQPLAVLLPERLRAHHDEHIARFLAGETVARQMGERERELVGVRKNGEEFAAAGAISKLQVGSEIVCTVSLRDVSDERRREREDRLLAEIGGCLINAGADVRRIVSEVAQVMVHGTADWCSIETVEDGKIRRGRLVHADPAKAAVCAALERYAPRAGSSSPVALAIESRGPSLVSEVRAGFLESIAQDDRHLALMRELDAGSFIVVPLLARGQALGTLGLGAARTSRRFDARDLDLAERIAGRVALALDNARLHNALERALRARDEVLGVVAHDLRGPLNAIVLHARSLRRRQPGTQRDMQIAEHIHNAAMRMNTLVSDLLEVGRLEAGQKLAVHRTSVAPACILTEVVDHHAVVLEASDHHLELDVQPELPDVFADRARIVQILDNLLGNANKFAQSRVTVGAVRSEGAVMFRVKDDGPGIPDEAQAHVFDPFWQARTDRRGAGLGLSIVKGLVDAHGGRVWVESEVGAGTTVCFTVPVAS